MTVKEAAGLFERAGVAFDPDSSNRRVPRVPVPEAPTPVEGPVDTLLILWGHCPSKKNLWRRGKAGVMYLDTEVKKQIEALTLQAMLKWGSEHKGPVEHPDLTVTFIVSAQRQDQDGMYTTVLDCLQDAGVIVNDNIAHFNGRKILEPCQIYEQADERVEILLVKK